MKPDPLESRLARVPLAQPPEAWRAEILTTARASLATPAATKPAAHPASTPTWRRWLTLLAHPLPTLAAAWAAVALLQAASGWIDNHATGTPTRLASATATTPDTDSRPSAPSLAVAREHRDRILELAAHDDGDLVADSRTQANPRHSPSTDRPRSASPPYPRAGSFPTDHPSPLWT